MALIKDKISFVRSIGTIVDVDMGVVDKVFGNPIPVSTSLIEYDTATVSGVLPDYNSFRNTANVVSKDGKDTVKIAPVNFNNSISKDAIDAEAMKFGENIYGDGIVDARMEALLNGVGKLHLNALVGTKKIAYEALTTFKIAKGYQGKNGTEDIVFPVPAANKEVLDGTTYKLWSDTANATPLVDIKRAFDAMLIKPTFIIMNSVTYAYFIANANVLTADDASAGKMKNFYINENVDGTKYFYKAGKIIYNNVIVDVFVENGVYKDKTGATKKYLEDGYVIYTNAGNGELYYGGIPKAQQGGVRNVRVIFDVDEVLTIDPPMEKVVYRTAPLPVLKTNEGFYSQKTF